MNLNRTLPLAFVILAPCLVSAQTQAGAMREKPAGPQWLAPDAAAEKTLQDALADARSSHKRLAVMYSGSWCDLCEEITTTVHGDPELMALADHYRPVSITVDRAALDPFAAGIHGKVPDRNAALITVLDSDGMVVSAIFGPRLLDAGHVSAAKFKAIFKEFTLGAPAEEVLTSSLPALATSNKLGWVEFRADWCGWCHRMEDFFQKTAAAPIMAKYFTVIPVDTEKNEGAEKMSHRLGSPKGIDGIPWFAVVDAKGNVLATSEGPKGNIGFPDSDVEVAHFFSILKKTAPAMTQADIQTLKNALTEINKKK